MPLSAETLVVAVFIVGLLVVLGRRFFSKSRQVRRYDQSDVEFPQVPQAGPAAATDQGIDVALCALAEAVKQRDAETVFHSKRTVWLTQQLARRFKVPEQAERWIAWGCLLHDIGKLVVPDHILLKPGPLTEEEWKTMRRHPEVGYQILSQVALPDWTLDIVRFHQERWDGSGYPFGLKGDEIPLIARIFAVADIFDALTSDRPYRAALSQEEALALISAEAGKTLDPVVCQALIDLVRQYDVLYPPDDEGLLFPPSFFNRFSDV